MHYQSKLDSHLPPKTSVSFAILVIHFLTVCVSSNCPFLLIKQLIIMPASIIVTISFLCCFEHSTSLFASNHCPNLFVYNITFHHTLSFDTKKLIYIRLSDDLEISKRWFSINQYNINLSTFFYFSNVFKIM